MKDWVQWEVDAHRHDNCSSSSCNLSKRNDSKTSRNFLLHSRKRQRTCLQVVPQKTMREKVNNVYEISLKQFRFFFYHLLAEIKNGNSSAGSCTWSIIQSVKHDESEFLWAVCKRICRESFSSLHARRWTAQLGRRSSTVDEIMFLCKLRWLCSGLIRVDTAYLDGNLSAMQIFSSRAREETEDDVEISLKTFLRCAHVGTLRRWKIYWYQSWLSSQAFLRIRSRLWRQLTCDVLKHSSSVFLCS